MRLYQQDLPVPSLKRFYIWTPEITLLSFATNTPSHHLMLVIDLQVAEWLHIGIIILAPPDSPWNSPLTVVPKKDADSNVTQWRVCIDPRLLNKLLLDLTYPIPTIHSIISKVQGFFIASALDLIWSYTQCPIAPKDCIKTTFTWNGCHYMFVTAIFGIKIVAQHFQHLMDVVTATIAEFTSHYIDDLAVISQSVEEHIEHLIRVILTLTAAGLCIHQEKCQFEYKHLCILSFIIDCSNILPDQCKLSTFTLLKVPSTGKQMQSFLGFAGYLHNFIPMFAQLVQPLDALRYIKDVGPHWNQDCQDAFDALKHILSNPPMLSLYDPSLPLLVGTNASHFGVGAVLYQIGPNNKHWYITFVSKALNPAQCNYPATK